MLPGLAAAWLESILTHGHWGVDLFFVLSGFTLGLGFVRQYDTGRVERATEFFARRAARILPAFYVALAIHLVWHAELFGAAAIWRALATHAVLLQGYLAPGRIVLIGASWSLTTEAHFYVLAPLLAWVLLGRGRGLARSDAAPRWNPTRLLAFLTAGCLAVWLLRAVLHDMALEPEAHAGLLELSQRRWVVSRVDQFVVGLAGALAYVRVGARLAARPAMAASLVVASIGLLGMAAPLDAAMYLRPGGVVAYPLVTLSMGTLVFAGACLREGRAAPVLAPLRWLGVVSYGVFLYHQLALEIAGRWLPGAGGDASWVSLLVTASGGLGLACLAGWMSWVLLESPVLAWTSARLRRERVSQGHDSASVQALSTPPGAAP